MFMLIMSLELDFLRFVSAGWYHCLHFLGFWFKSKIQWSLFVCFYADWGPGCEIRHFESKWFQSRYVSWTRWQSIYRRSIPRGMKTKVLNRCNHWQTRKSRDFICLRFVLHLDIPRVVLHMWLERKQISPNQEWPLPGMLYWSAVAGELTFRYTKQRKNRL